ncbi:ATP-binding protein [Thermotoga profunda]|uniref:ATP-binding protein n=1 Tax=Thermotoga profunda TaxID=1508420 RepID=UPI000597D0AF|nr:ATP-binding protein [Thermotoga profunda]
MKKLPIGINDYKQIIEGNYIYVDKTRYLHEMATTGIYYFLSRPRRFGKSLTVSTFYYLFTGEKELFKDTWIYNNWDWEKERYPVVVLDMNKIDSTDLETLRESIQMMLLDYSKEYGIEFQTKTVSNRIQELIKNIHLKTSKPVVLLIDEYEKPILDHITNKAKIEEMRNELRQFYGKIKSLGSSLRFVFITGITKFTKMGVFSALNNLEDISYYEKFSQMFGYTQEEIEKYFHDYTDNYLRKNHMTKEEFFERLENYYNGFSFDGKHKVYNPFAVLLFYKSGEFAEYWHESGAPQFLYDYFINKKVDLNEILKDGEVEKSELSKREIEETTPKVFLIQSGYLTFEQIIEQGRYKIDFPNIDVKKSIGSMLLEINYQISDEKKRQISAQIEKAIKEEDIDRLIEVFKTVISGMSYRITGEIERHVKEERVKNLEMYYQSLVYCILAASGYNVETEVETGGGRIDIILKTDGTVYIFELKIDQPASKAIEQIRQKRYHESYKYKRCYLVGISISSEERNIKEWKYEKV